MDYDDMKQKYLPLKNVRLCFAINFDNKGISNAKYVKKLIDCIYDELGEGGSIVCHRYKNDAIIIIENNLPINFFGILKAIDGHMITMKLPLLLYKKKDHFENLVEEIRQDNCLAKLVVDTDVFICIAGRLKDVLHARKRILYNVEKLMNKEPECYKGYISSELLLKKKVRLFFVSKINGQEVILSGRKNIQNEVENKFIPRQEILEEALYYDSIKTAYAFFYFRDIIEDILVENDCYIAYELTCITTKLCIKSFFMLNLRKCVQSIKNLFQDIVKISFDDDFEDCEHKMFTFESGLSIKNREIGKYLSVGLRSEIKRFIENSLYKYEIEIDIDSNLEDFLCGKKNGKINKICRDNDCQVVLSSKTVDGEKKIALYISGIGNELFKTIISLESEYPAELSFQLHERHHRRIIGYGGKNIQRVMKKHGVYIKFMSEEERILFGHDGNVIIKTPKRNVSSLKKMKEEIMEIAEEPSIDKIEVKRELDLYTYYEYFFERPLMWLNSIFIMKLLPPKIMIYLISEFSGTQITNKDYIRAVRLEDSTEIYLYSFEKLELELITYERWLDRKPDLTFKLFDSVLLYAYEPTFDMDFGKSRRNIDFSKKFKEYDSDVFAVGNRKKEGDSQTK